MATANDLAACLEDPAFAEATGALGDAVVSVRASETPQALTLRIADHRVRLEAGAAEDADLVATLGGTALRPEIDTAGSRPELAEWVAKVFDPPVPPWQECGERFWSVLKPMAGAPGALLLVNLDDNGRRRYGSKDVAAYEIHGTTDGLVEVLTGRASMMEAAFEGTVSVRGGFPDLSVLSGAGFEIRYGRRATGG